MTRAWLMFGIAWMVLMLSLASLLTGCAPYPVEREADDVDTSWNPFRDASAEQLSGRDDCLNDGGVFTIQTNSHGTNPYCLGLDRPVENPR